MPKNTNRTKSFEGGEVDEDIYELTKHRHRGDRKSERGPTAPQEDVMDADYPQTAHEKKI